MKKFAGDEFVMFVSRLWHWRELRRLRPHLAVLKAENDQVFWFAVEEAPQRLRGKARLRWALDVLKIGDEYREEKALRLRIAVLEGRYTPNADGTYTVRATA